MGRLALPCSLWSIVCSLFCPEPFRPGGVPIGMDRIAWILTGSAVVDVVVMTGAVCFFARCAKKKTGDRRQETGGGRLRRERGEGLAEAVGYGRAFGVFDCIAVAGTAGVISVGKMIVLLLLGVRMFGMMRVVYLFLAVAVPLAGVLVLVGRFRGLPGFSKLPATRGAIALAVVALSFAPLAAYASFIEPYRLQLEHARVETGKAPGRRRVVVRVAVLADLQFDRVTEHEWRAVRMAMDERPDVIVLPGDLFQGTEAEFERALPDIRELLGALEAPGGVYLIEGNVDSPGTLPRAVAGTGVQFLRDEVAYTRVSDTDLAVGGLTWGVRSASAGGRGAGAWRGR